MSTVSIESGGMLNVNNNFSGAGSQTSLSQSEDEESSEEQQEDSALSSYER